MVEDIFAFAKTVGQVSAEQEEILLSLCQTAETELKARLREDKSPEDCQGAFVIAAAWLALAGLCVSRQSGESITSWTAGDVSIQGRENAGEQADIYRAQARRLMAPYIKDGEFAFLGVRG